MAKLTLAVCNVRCTSALNSQVSRKSEFFSGRIWAGTMRPQACTSLNIPTYGNLYRLGLALEQDSTKLFDDDFVLVSNGLCWDENTFYYVDSCYKDVKAFDYDPDTGDICTFQ